MRRLAALAIPLLLAACASSSVTLLPGEAGAPAGSVVVLNPKTEAEKGVLDKPDTRTGFSKVAPRKVKSTLWAKLTQGFPPPAARFTLYFVEGTTTLVPDSEVELTRLFAEIANRSNNGVSVQITGHTDTVGTDADNDILSLRRAIEIRGFLAEKGLDLSITRTAGRGERELLEPTEDNVPNEHNRRVEVIVR